MGCTRLLGCGQCSETPTERKKTEEERETEEGGGEADFFRKKFAEHNPGFGRDLNGTDANFFHGNLLQIFRKCY